MVEQPKPDENSIIIQSLHDKDKNFGNIILPEAMRKEEFAFPLTRARFLVLSISVGKRVGRKIGKLKWAKKLGLFTTTVFYGTPTSGNADFNHCV